jgi:ribokinase
VNGPILVAGAINTDVIAYVDRAPDAGETVTGRSYEILAGGKGANQAVAAARSGSRTVMLGGVGPDDFGTARTADLKADRVDTRWIQLHEGEPSGVASITVEKSGENRIAYIPGATLAVDEAHCLAAVESCRPSMILAANELSQACHRVLFGWASQHRVPVVYNVAPFSDEGRELVPMVDVLIVNQGEARALLAGSDASPCPEELGRGLISMGASRVVITLGADGAIGVSGDEVVRIHGRAVDAVDTTGAGDTFCGAFASRLNEGASFEDALAYGNVAASISVTRRGAQPSIPTKSEIEAIIG